MKLVSAVSRRGTGRLVCRRRIYKHRGIQIAVELGQLERAADRFRGGSGAVG